MTGSTRNFWIWLALILLASVPLIFLSVVLFRHRQSLKDARALEFQAAAENIPIVHPTGAQQRMNNPSDQLMTLDSSGKFLISTKSHRAVFITGDDAWSLQVQLSDDDIRLYLDDRASRGFNAIWVGLADNTFSSHPPRDFYGNAPFNGPDFANENPAYWARVDQTLHEAAARGITVFASPAFVGYCRNDGYCQSYRDTSLQVISAYGEFLGKRYREFPNIVWLIGGDADPGDHDVQSKLYVLAGAIRANDALHLITTESSRGKSSIDVWSQAPWLDLDALYAKPSEIPNKAAEDYLAGKRPVFLFEDWYEGGVGIDERGVREEGYEAVLNGCILGRFFGNNSIWTFNYSSQQSPPWKTQLNSPGSVGQELLGKLFRSREHWKLIPDKNHSVIKEGYETRSFYSSSKESLRSLVYRVPYRVASGSPAAASTSDGQTIIAYLPKGNATNVTIALDQIRDPSSQAKGWWFNPRNGGTTAIGTFKTSGLRKFTAPDTNDWVLVIDSVNANLPPPGNKDL